MYHSKSKKIFKSNLNKLNKTIQESKVISLRSIQTKIESRSKKLGGQAEKNINNLAIGINNVS